MMGFLSPALLVLGAAVAVPLILHLLHRHQGPRLVFPALRYLRRAEKESARRIKLRQLLLMALRLAVLILLVLAASRPFLRSGGAGHEPTAVVIILDNSLSSGLINGEERVLDQLKARALETLERARPDDRFWLIRAGSPWEPAAMDGPVAAAERVRQTEISAGRADLDEALARASALLAVGADGRAAEVHLLTDLQASSFHHAGATGNGAGTRPPLLIWGPREAAPTNVGIAAVTVGGGIAPRANERSTISVRLSGTADRDSLPMRLILADRVAAATTATPGATSLLPFPARPTGLVTGRVELDPDALRGDDVRYFVTRVEPPPSVAITGKPTFIAEALDVLSDAGRIRRAGTEGADVIVAPAAAGLEQVHGGAAAVILAPTTATELPAANRRLAEAGIPWRFGPPTGGGEARLATDELDDELLTSLSTIRIRSTYDLRQEGQADDQLLLRLRDGRPWAVRGELPGGSRYILIASPLSTDATTLPTSSALVPLLDRLTGAWVAAAPTRSDVIPGGAVALPAEATAIVRPDGSRDTLMADAGYRAPGRPGIYQIFAGDQLIDAFAVNHDPVESDLTRLDDRELRAALPGWNPEMVKNPADWTDAIFHQRLGREIWKPLVLAALALLLIEGLVAAAGRATGTGRGGESGRKRKDIPVAASQMGAGVAEPDTRTSYT
jgi:hypothetical protein